MRYHYLPPKQYASHYGETYVCDHPLYDRCTLYRIRDEGLAVIQQRFSTADKRSWWTEIDPWLTDAIYLHPGFLTYFRTHADIPDRYGLYPTVTVRSLMWALKMKPIRKERWETVFDRKEV